MEIDPDRVVLWQAGPVSLNQTLVTTWIVMAILVVGSWLVTRLLRTTQQTGPYRPFGFNLCDTLVGGIRDQIRQVAGEDPDPYLPMVGTLFLFISVSSLLTMVPGFHPPTGSLSTTAALAVAVLLYTPIFGIAHQGLRGFLKHYLEPSLLMLPFHLLSEVTRTVALAVRLFGNSLSGGLVVGIILSLVPLFFPLVMQMLELLIGQVQAYIFAVLATVYMASASRVHAGNGKGVKHG